MRSNQFAATPIASIEGIHTVIRTALPDARGSTRTANFTGLPTTEPVYSGAEYSAIPSGSSAAATPIHGAARFFCSKTNSAANSASLSPGITNTYTGLPPRASPTRTQPPSAFVTSPDRINTDASTRGSRSIRASSRAPARFKHQNSMLPKSETFSRSAARTA